MATLNDLVRQIENDALRERIEEELRRVAKQKKFGLVFEEHLPECTPLWEIPVKRGSLVARKDGKMSDVWRVLAVADGKAVCVKDGSIGDGILNAETQRRGEENAVGVEFVLSDLVVVAKFGEPIYPYLKPLDTVANAPESDLWHTLIEADNYHALQFLEYVYAGKVDCIYIDPPYNTGAKDWKYNNDFVDDSDSYRHSKWLSMMQKRLALARKLLNPRDSVLIVTIDEKEYLHLGCLLEEMFPEARIQMVSIIINKNGVQRSNAFKRTEEYAFYVMLGDAVPREMAINDYSPFASRGKVGVAAATVAVPTEQVRWEWLLRGGSNSLRTSRPNLFYPIYVDEETKTIRHVGDSIPLNTSRESVPIVPGLRAIWPLRTNGTEATWHMQPSSLLKKMEKGLVRVGEYDIKNDRYTILYLADIQEARIANGDLIVTGKRDDGSLIVEYAKAKKSVPPTVWGGPLFSASEHGSRMITKIFNDKRFQFPKSVYATKLAIAPFVADKSDALVVDFFAGSGTTLHAINLLNAEDGGRRHCVLVTNNEISEAEAKALRAKGCKPGDEEWERLGIARYVTWPRTVCSIEGHDVNCQPLKGKYLGCELAMADGFKANAAFFKLGFLDKTSVSLGRQFREMLPTLWMKAGAHGPCPTGGILAATDARDFLILPANRFAVLLEESAFNDFLPELDRAGGVEIVYLVTDYAQSYKSMANALKGRTTYQLYRDYLDNFRINKEGR